MEIGKIADGVYLSNAPAIIVESGEKLDLIEGAQPGTIAYTAGYAHLGPDRVTGGT